VDVGEREPVTIEDVPRDGETDLILHEFEVGCDLRVTGMTIDPPNPAPGSQAEVTVTVANFGDAAQANVGVALYDGDPRDGGRRIGEIAHLAETLPGQGSASLSWTWTVPETDGSHLLTAVVDPDAQIDEIVEDNNTGTLNTVLADIEVTGLTAAWIAGDTYELRARVKNTGVIGSGPFTLTFTAETGGREAIGSVYVPGVCAGWEDSIPLEWDASGATLPVNIRCKAAPDPGWTELDSTNNESAMMFRPPVVRGLSAPTNFTATPATDRITLTWDDVGTDEDGYRILRGETAENMSEIGFVGADVTEYVDTTVARGQTYYYAVFAYNGAGVGPRTEPVQSQTLPDADLDNLPDAWEQQIIDADPNDAFTTVQDVLPGDDFDGDGRTNAEEYADGTDPTDPESVVAVAFAETASNAAEGVGTVSIPVELTSPSARTVTVNYAVTGGTATGGGADYTLADGTLTFAPGETSKTVDVAIVDDAVAEGDETVEITLSNPTNAVLGAPSLYVLTIEDNDVWEIVVNLTHADKANVVFGMTAGATDDFDEGIDVDTTAPAPNAAGVYFEQLAMFYERDYRPVTDAADWLLIAKADSNNPVQMSWTLPGDFPRNRYLTMFEVNATPGRSGRDTTRTPIGNTAVNMAEVTSMTVPAGETRAFVVRFADHLTADLGLKPGWNLVSLPFEPVTPAVSAIFAAATRASAGSGLRDGTRRGTINVGAVWSWTNGIYQSVTELHAGVGYWVYMENAAVIEVPGLPAGLTALPLVRGWNLVGVPDSAPFAVPQNPHLRGRCWRWDVATQAYEPVDAMTPFLGHWLNSSEDFDLPIAR